ncbi:MAG: DUF2341 domain-containing protein [Candidatus Acidifodinimicrobium sp.]
MLKVKYQASLEFLTTYGWAIAVIVLVLIILYSLGIFSFSNSVPNSISGFSSTPVLSVEATSNSLMLDIDNNVGQPINITGIVANSSGSSYSTFLCQYYYLYPSQSTVCIVSGKFPDPAYVSVTILYNIPTSKSVQLSSTGNLIVHLSTIQSPSMPMGVIAYEKIFINNSQSSPTPSPFQQMVNVSNSVYNGYAASNFQNVEFFYANGTTIPSWLESYTYPNNAIYWVKLGSIPAHTSIPIYIGFAPQTYNLFNGVNVGEAPQLSSTYGEYDDGANVFNFYDNFAGTTLSSKWVANGASYTINNSLTYANGVNDNELDTATSFTAPYIIDYYGSGTAGSEDGGVYFNIQAQAANSNSYLWAQRASEGTDMFYTYISGSYTQEASWSYSIDGNKHIYTLIVGLSDNPLITQTDYNTKESFTSMPTTYTSGYFGPRSLAGTTYWQWARVRAYPPNGVMPSVGFGSVI